MEVLPYAFTVKQATLNFISIAMSIGFDTEAEFDNFVDSHVARWLVDNK